MIIRLEIKDRFGGFRVFLWDKRTGRIGLLKKGEDINKGYDPEILDLEHDPAFNIGAAELLAYAFLQSNTSDGY